MHEIPRLKLIMINISKQLGDICNKFKPRLCFLTFKQRYRKQTFVAAILSESLRVMWMCVHLQFPQNRMKNARNFWLDGCGVHCILIKLAVVSNLCRYYLPTKYNIRRDKVVNMYIKCSCSLIFFFWEMFVLNGKVTLFVKQYFIV